MTREVCPPSDIAFSTVWQVVNILQAALANGQGFTVKVSEGKHELPPTLGGKGQLCARGELDGGYDIRIRVEPLPTVEVESHLSQRGDAGRHAGRG